MAVDLSTGDYREVVALYGTAAAGYAHSGEGTPMDRMHAAEGIQEEAVELVEVVDLIYSHGGRFADGIRNRLKGEMGGVMWYVNYGAHVHGHTLADVMAAGSAGLPLSSAAWERTGHPETFRDLTVPLLIAAREVGSRIKKVTYHGKPAPEGDADLLAMLRRVWVRVAVIGGAYNVQVREAMAYNLAELQERHGGPSFDPTVYTEGRK